MAKAAWNTLSKTSGTGNDTFTTAGSVHTGRAARSSTNTVAAGGATSLEVAVTQSGAGNILRNDTPETIPGVGARIAVSGISNESLLTFAISGAGFTLGTPQVSTDNTTWTDITSGTAIKGDPGAVAAYEWRIPVMATANTGRNDRYGTLSVVTSEKQSISITLTQESAATLSTA